MNVGSVRMKLIIKEIEKCNRMREKLRTVRGASITMKTRKMWINNFYGKRR